MGRVGCAVLFLPSWKSCPALLSALGKANEATIRALAKAFDLKAKDIEIISGETNRDKRVKVTGDVIEIQKLHLALINK